ncbi:hypothetical protein PI124_g932 [Phytophthora idaei]|nr:hypothetical protein PI124_g932 [Phytophthora idaei]
MISLLTTWCNKLLLARRTFRDSVASAKVNKLDGDAHPCPLRSRNVLGNETERELALDKPSGNVPVELNNLSVIAIALIKKSDGQVRHRKDAKEGESTIVFGTSDNWKKMPKKNRKRGKSAIVFGTSDNWKRKPWSNGKRAKSVIIFVTKKVEP